MSSVSPLFPDAFCSDARLIPSAAQKYVLCTYNIERAKLDIAKSITPGNRAPTVTSLEESGWVAISVMVQRKQIAIVMDKLTEAGACDILVTKIENSRTHD